MKVSVIIPAAGRGSRFGGKRNKIFERLGRGPVFLRTLESFVNRDDVCQTILVVSDEDRAIIKDRFAANLGFMAVKLVTGGSDRTGSVRNALAEVSDEADMIAVHDAVRPCVSSIWIDEVFAAAAESGAAILAYPVHGTLKRVASEIVAPEQVTLAGEPIKAGKPVEKLSVEATVSREDLWQAQTPQVFTRQWLIDAYRNAGDEVVTDDAQLVEATGKTVRIVRGDPRNIKITTRGDLSLAAAVIDSLPKPKPKPGGAFEEAQW